MEIQFNPGGVPPGSAPRGQASRAAAPAKQDDAVFANREIVRAAMQQIPDTRPDVVGRAQALVASINYPPPAGVDSIARLLAIHLSTQP